MANEKFDAKSFNPEAFKYLLGRVPNLKVNELLKSRAVRADKEIKDLFATQDGTSYARMAVKGLLDGDVLNYDGQTDIVATSTKTFERGVVVFGRAKAWLEKDFSYDITGGEDFMKNVAAQVAEYWNAVSQDTLLAILEGIFSMTGVKNLEFVNKHTTDANGNMTATTLNSATNKACGQKKKAFSLVFMHSDVSTNLENMNLITYLKYTDENGLQRDLSLGTWNGKLVVVDDSMPVETGYYAATADTEGALKLVADTATPAAGEIKVGDVTMLDGTTATAGGYVVEGGKYTTYVLGDGAFDYADIGAKKPNEMARDPFTDGGVDTLITRRRKCFAPKWISYEKAVQASLSPTDAELANGANWTLCHSGESVAANRSFVDHKAIPIVRIISRG